MEALKVILLVTALCIGTAFSLQCYTCTGESSNANCMTATNCTAGSDSYCKTSVIAGGIGALTYATITKECASTCVETNLGIVVYSSSISCCSTNLCDTSGAPGMKSGYAMLALSVLLPLALLRGISL
ncbi:lymphocyte antigen 6E-like [Discoglossus pictus]